MKEDSGNPRSETLLLQAAPAWLKSAARNVLLTVVVGTYWEPGSGLFTSLDSSFDPPLDPESTKANFVSTFINEESEP